MASNPKSKKRTPKKGRKRAGKRTKPSADWAPAFLANLRGSGNVRASCTAAGVVRSVVYERKASDEAFAQQWADSLADAIDDLEQIAFDRAKAESDTLLIFLLKSHRRSVYGDKVEVTAANRLVIEEEVVGGNGPQDDSAAPQAG